MSRFGAWGHGAPRRLGARWMGDHWQATLRRPYICTHRHATEQAALRCSGVRATDEEYTAYRQAQQ